MSKARNTGNLNNAIQVSSTGAITFMSGSTMLATINTAGQMSGSSPVLFAATASYADAFTVAGTLTAQTLVVQTITSSVDFVTGSTRFGTVSSNTHVFTGSVLTSGSISIGTTSTAHLLNISTPSSSASGIQITKAGVLTSFLGDGGSVYPVGVLNMYDSGSQKVQIYAGGVSYFMGGNVGIGTTNPLAQLHVYGNGAGVYTLLRINNDNSTANFHIGVGGSGVPNGVLQNNAFVWNVGNSATIFGTNDTERMRIGSDGIAELKQYWKIGTGINGTQYTVLSENQLYRAGGGILYINSSGTGDVSIANGGGKVGIGIASPSYPLQTKDVGTTSINTYFGTGYVRIGGGSDHGSNTVLSVAPGVVTFDRPGDGGGAMKIDGNGYVTKPSQPSFMAVSNAAQQGYTGGQVMVFNLTRHNTGNHYNTSNGRFTAPVTGKYLFSINFYTYSGFISAIVLTINGSQYTPSDVVPYLYRAASIGEVNLSFSIILELSINDYVEVRTRSGGNTSQVYMSHSHFSGQLLS
jgi:hypothetical protein